jgi:ferredoxin-NADP reductase
MQVVGIVAETDSARTLRLRPLQGELPAFRAGQHLSLEVMIDGQTLRRAYSLSRPPGGDCLEVTIKRIAGGRVSTYLCTQVQLGEVLQVWPPRGDFVWPQGCEQALMVAGGSGITPIMSLLDWALAQSATRAIHLLYANRSPQDTIFASRLQALAASDPRLQIQWVFDAYASAQAWAGPLTTQAMERWLQDKTEQPAMICGPTGLKTLAEQALQAQGWASEQIVIEDFVPASDGVTPSAQPQTVLLARSGRRLQTRAGESVLEAALREGLPLPYSCTVGGCGHCKAKVLAGDIRMQEPNTLSHAEREAGWRLLCVGYAQSAVELDL